MPEVIDIISVLERVAVTKELLEVSVFHSTFNTIYKFVWCISQFTVLIGINSRRFVLICD